MEISVWSNINLEISKVHRQTIIFEYYKNRAHDIFSTSNFDEQNIGVWNYMAAIQQTIFWKYIFLTPNVCILIQISLNFVSMDSIYSKS